MNSTIHPLGENSHIKMTGMFAVPCKGCQGSFGTYVGCSTSNGSQWEILQYLLEYSELKKYDRR